MPIDASRALCMITASTGDRHDSFGFFDHSGLCMSWGLAACSGPSGIVVVADHRLDLLQYSEDGGSGGRRSRRQTRRSLRAPCQRRLDVRARRSMRLLFRSGQAAAIIPDLADRRWRQGRPTRQSAAILRHIVRARLEGARRTGRLLRRAAGRRNQIEPQPPPGWGFLDGETQQGRPKARRLRLADGRRTESESQDGPQRDLFPQRRRADGRHAIALIGQPRFEPKSVPELYP